jgi:protein-disulfide isomerase
LRRLAAGAGCLPQGQCRQRQRYKYRQRLGRSGGRRAAARRQGLVRRGQRHARGRHDDGQPQGSNQAGRIWHFAETGFKPLVSKYVDSGKVSYEYRSFAIHSVDVPLTVLVRCAAPQAFFGLVEQLYGNQEAVLNRAMKAQKEAEAASKLPIAKRFIAISDAMGFTDFFSARGISVDQAHSCLADPAAAERIAKDAQTFGDQGVDSTPTMMINGSKTSASTWEDLQPLLQKAGAR